MTSPESAKKILPELIARDDRSKGAVVASIPFTDMQVWRFALAIIVIPLLTFVATYTISLTVQRNGHVMMEYPYLFLSSSIAHKPASCVGAFFLLFGVIPLPVIAFVRFTKVKRCAEKLRRSEVISETVFQRVSKANYRSSLSSLSAILGVHGVLSFQADMSNNCGGSLFTIGMHLLFALLFFSSGCYYCCVSWRIDQTLPHLGRPLARLGRKVSAIFTITLLLLSFVAGVFGAVFYLLRDRDDSHDISGNKTGINSLRPNLDTRSQTIVFLFSVLEVLILISFMGTFFTFISEFRGTTFSLCLVVKEKQVYATASSFEELGGEGKSQTRGLQDHRSETTPLALRSDAAVAEI